MVRAMKWGRSRREKALVERYVVAINAHDVATLESLMSDDFTYIDSWRESITGRDRILDAFRSVIAADPEFALEVDSMDWREPHALMTGRIKSSLAGAGGRAVWQVRVDDGKITEYQAWSEGGQPPIWRYLASLSSNDPPVSGTAAPGAELGE